MKDIIRIEAVIRTESPLSIKMPVAEGSRENHFENFPVMTRGIDADGNKAILSGKFITFLRI